jgi:hypothetical protein
MSCRHCAAAAAGFVAAAVLHAGGAGAAARYASPRAGTGSLPASVIIVINDRRVTLSRMEIRSDELRPRRVARLSTHLASRQRTRIGLSPPRGCRYVVQADFADGSERRYQDYDFCLDGTVRFFD